MNWRRKKYRQTRDNLVMTLNAEAMISVFSLVMISSSIILRDYPLLTALAVLGIAGLAARMVKGPPECVKYSYLCRRNEPMKLDVALIFVSLAVSGSVILRDIIEKNIDVPSEYFYLGFVILCAWIEFEGYLEDIRRCEPADIPADESRSSSEKFLLEK